MGPSSADVGTGGIEAREVVFEEFDDPPLLVQRWERDRNAPELLLREMRNRGPG
jgi:hypothetical protein